MKGYIAFHNPALGTIYLKALTFIGLFPSSYTYQKKEAPLFDEYTFKQISKTFNKLHFVKHQYGYEKN